MTVVLITSPIKVCTIFIGLFVPTNLQNGWTGFNGTKSNLGYLNLGKKIVINFTANT